MRQGQCENGGPRSEYRIQLDNWFMLLDLCLADDSLVFVRPLVEASNRLGALDKHLDRVGLLLLLLLSFDPRQKQYSLRMMPNLLLGITWLEITRYRFATSFSAGIASLPYEPVATA